MGTSSAPFAGETNDGAPGAERIVKELLLPSHGVPSVSQILTKQLLEGVLGIVQG